MIRLDMKTDNYLTGDEEQRREIINSLACEPVKNALPLILMGMADESWRIRKEAVQIFCAMESDEEDMTALFTLIRNHENAGARNSAVEALTRCGARALPLLSPLLTDSDHDVRKFAVDTIGSIGGESAMPLLSDALRDEDVNVASAAAEHLGKIHSPGSLSTLLDSVHNRKEPFFLFNALSAIGNIASPAPVPEQIMELLGDEILRKAVYDCLGSIADESAAALLSEALLLPHKSARNAAVIALYRIFSRSSAEGRASIIRSIRLQGDPATDSLINAYSKNNNQLAEATVTLLEALSDIRSVPFLLGAMDNYKIAATALNALNRLGAEAKKYAFALYDTANENIKAAICRLCAECREKLCCEETICKAVIDASPLVRRSALAALARLGLIKLLPRVKTLLDDPDFTVREEAAAAIFSLVLINKQQIAELNIQLMHSENSWHREISATLSASLGDPSSLMLLAKDPEPKVRSAAVKGVGENRIPSTESLLVMALVDEDPEVRVAAAEAITATGSVAMKINLVNAIDDTDEWVRAAVIKGLAALDPENIQKHICLIIPQASALELITILRILENSSAKVTEELLPFVKTATEDRDREVSAIARSILEKNSP